MNELLIKQFEQNYYNYSKEIRNMLLKLDTESLIAKLARDSKNVSAQENSLLERKIWTYRAY